MSYTTVGGSLLVVTGGSVTGARRLTPKDNSGWEVSAQPSGNDDIVITLPSRACDQANAVCVGGQPLAAEVSVTIPRAGPRGAEPSRSPPSPRRSRVRSRPSTTGRRTWSSNSTLSHNPGHLSYETVRDDLFTVTGGTIERAWRRTRGAERHMHWNLRVDPDGDGDGDVAIELNPTTDCAWLPGVCRLADDAKLDSDLKLTVKGPATLSVADATVARGRRRNARLRGDAEPQAPGRDDGALCDLRRGPRRVGSDYTSTSGTLSFGLNETSKTVSVPVLDDIHNEGGETVTLTLSNPTPSAYVRLSDANRDGDHHQHRPDAEGVGGALRAHRRGPGGRCARRPARRRGRGRT